MGTGVSQTEYGHSGRHRPPAIHGPWSRRRISCLPERFLSNVRHQLFSQQCWHDADLQNRADAPHLALSDRSMLGGSERAGWAVLPMNPHLTLTLSPPIGWERRGNSRRTRLVPRKFAEQRQVQGSNAQVAFGKISARRSRQCGVEPPPRPGGGQRTGRPTTQDLTKNSIARRP